MQPLLLGLRREARISHPELAPELVGALNETDCFAARTAIDTVEVFAPWLLDGGDTLTRERSCSSSFGPGRRATRTSGRRCSSPPRTREPRPGRSGHAATGR